MADKQVFVTVGTTSFDELIETLSSKTICQLLKKNGFKKVIMQIGRGQFEPPTDVQCDVELQYYRYKNSIDADILNADLVISHAGAGSCLEVLSAKKPLIVVINEGLMDNHQTELAEKLYREGHILYGTCSDLASKLHHLDISRLRPFESGRPEKFASFLDKLMGIS
ncbi:hypothetical protein LSH36_13g26088 [Paralvinella palmiformis]|uniref:UDP-N-acetylglucosamine transferase subunit ALG13 n=1 Tax=Paralvinella palmiformis TaxID=53620 RepID=A0AAD9KCV0_9ANNE|nr:hypothetical protein LSH36_13g26088 [Paralvinella palmiformis]